MTSIKTHYSVTEYHAAIEEKVPRLSAWTLLRLEEILEIDCVRAGAQSLYRANDLQRVLDWLEQAKAERRLISRKGFLVAPEFDGV